MEITEKFALTKGVLFKRMLSYILDLMNKPQLVNLLHYYVVIGMGAVVSDYVLMKEWAVLGEAGLARQGQKFEPGEIGVGVPAKIVGNIHDESKSKVKTELFLFKKKYSEMASRYLKKGAFKKVT
ncbi:MAG: hypothetical protein ACXADW_17315 [Candidatus Hodarchaeales archaeon]